MSIRIVLSSLLTPVSTQLCLRCTPTVLDSLITVEHEGQPLLSNGSNNTTILIDFIYNTY